MTQTEMASELVLGLEYISECTYDNFIESFESSRDEYGEVTRLEAAIPSIFLFDYMLCMNRASTSLRGQVVDGAFELYLGRFKNSFPFANLGLHFTQRQEEYSQIPYRLRERWAEGYVDSIERCLQGTRGMTTVQSKYNLVVWDAFEKAPKLDEFFRREGYKLRLANAIIEKILSGKSCTYALTEFYNEK